MSDPRPQSEPSPLARVDRSTRLSGFQRLALVTTVLTLVLVAFGGVVRATGSGLACPTWPGCFSAGDWIPPAGVNVWLEHTHRLLAGVVGLCIAALLIWSLVHFRDRRDIWAYTVVAAVLVNAQAGLGAVVVWRQLRAELVTAHLALAMIVLGCLIALTVNVSLPRSSRAARAGRDLGLARAAALVTVLAYLQILVGGQVTGIGAGLAYGLDGFPLMDGAVVPAVGTEQQAFHVAHRLLAAALTVGVIGLCVAVVRRRRTWMRAGSWSPRHQWILRLCMWTAVLVVAQGVIGVANLATGLSFVTVVPHLAVASWIWAVLVLTTLLAYRFAPPLEPIVDPTTEDEWAAARGAPA